MVADDALDLTEIVIRNGIIAWFEPGSLKQPANIFFFVIKFRLMFQALLDGMTKPSTTFDNAAKRIGCTLKAQSGCDGVLTSAEDELQHGNSEFFSNIALYFTSKRDFRAKVAVFVPDKAQMAVIGIHEHLVGFCQGFCQGVFERPGFVGVWGWRLGLLAIF